MVVSQLSPELEEALQLHPEVYGSFDDAAMSMLGRADPARALEILDDIVSKGDIRNPSAFVAKALHQYPQKRGGGDASSFASQASFASQTPFRALALAPPEQDLVGAVLAQHPTIGSSLDEGAVRRLRAADPERAAEVLEELAAKADVNNPSAFVMKALASHPHKRGHPGDVDALLSQHPEVQASLDEAAIMKLRGADPARAVEIIEEVVSKGGDVQNTSAFVVKALTSYPHKRGQQKNVGQLLARHPEIRDSLDEAGSQRLGGADQARAVEIIEDIVAKGDVRNPSAFVAKALQLYPHRRAEGPQGPQGQGPQRRGLVERELAHHGHVAQSLDAEAQRALGQADPERAVEVVRDLAAKEGVRNPSAFVMQSLKAFPQKRGDPLDPESALARRPRVRAALDEQALQRLRGADPARAVEVIEDVAARSDVHNPSAFVVKALMAYPQKRSADTLVAAVQSVMKQPRFGAMPFSQLPAPLAKPVAAAGGVEGLDDQAQRMLQAANPQRAEEILEELAQKGSTVRNASAFVARALHQYPFPRGRKEDNFGS